MAQHLPGRAPVAATNNKDIPRVWVGEEGHMGHHLVVDKFIPLAYHNEPIV